MICLQQRIYTYIYSCIHRKGIPPSIREIGHAVGIPSTGTISSHLGQLERDGLITRKRFSPHSIQPTGLIPPWLALDRLSSGPLCYDVSATQEHFSQGYLTLQVRGGELAEHHLCDGDRLHVAPFAPGRALQEQDLVVLLKHRSEASCSLLLARLVCRQACLGMVVHPLQRQQAAFVLSSEQRDPEWQLLGNVLTVIRLY